MILTITWLIRAIAVDWGPIPVTRITPEARINPDNPSLTASSCSCVTRITATQRSPAASQRPATGRPARPRSPLTSSIRPARSIWYPWGTGSATQAISPKTLAPGAGRRVPAPRAASPPPPGRYRSRSRRSRSSTSSGLSAATRIIARTAFRERHPRHVERHGGRIRPGRQLPVELGAQVEGDPDRLGPDRGAPGGTRVGRRAAARRGGHPRLLLFPLRTHDRIEHRGAHRSTRSRATCRQMSQPVCLIGMPKLCAYTSRRGTTVSSTS